MEESAEIDLEVNRSDAVINDVLYQSDDLISVSFSSSLTFDRSSGPDNEKSFEQTGTDETDANKSTNEEIEEMPKLIETHEPEKSRKNVKFNLRKSLAWDNAFFTSDGVLDADELSTIIEGGDKVAKHYLSGIEEEVYRSTESISTLESDNLSLDCHEAELFENIRASIQNSNKSSTLNISSIKLSSGKTDSQPKVTSSSKKMDHDSGKKLGARTKDNNISSIPQPKITSRFNLNMNSTSALTKRASLSTNHAKKDQVNQNGSQTTKTITQVSKLTAVIGPQTGTQKPLLTSKSTSSGTSTTAKTDPTRPSSSCSNSSSCSSGTDVKSKSSVNFPRKIVDTKIGKLTTSSRISMKNKPPTVASNLSSRVSPARSINKWSSESSSSSSSRVSIDTPVQSDLSIHLKNRISSNKGNQSVVMHSFQSGSVSRLPTVQPTGLKMPSPKIGFFDGGKSGAQTPKRSIRSQSKLSTGGPITEATKFSQTNSNGEKFGKIPPPKTSTNMKPNPQKTTTKLSQQQQTSKPEPKTCHVISDAFSDCKSESSLNLCMNPSHNVESDPNKQSDLGINAHEVLSNKCFVVVNDDKMDKPVTDGSRTPFAVKNSVSEF